MVVNMVKRLTAILLFVAVILSVIPTGFVSAGDAGDGTVEISNDYIRVTVNKENGGYVISTAEGDILKKSDNNVSLTHRGEYFDTSFTSFKVDSSEYVFGEKYGVFGTYGGVDTKLGADGDSVVSVWSTGDIEVTQTISLVNNPSSEQLGTAMITYSVKNTSESAKSIKGRVLIDTQLGEKDYGYYEVPKQRLGQGYSYFESERTWDSSADPTVNMPSDYFVRDNPFSSSIVGYGVNSVFTEAKPYKMTFAHWANIAATVFDYTPDESLNFTNSLNSHKTADSAAALYYDLGSVGAGSEKSFSTYYGVTANLKNKDNKVIINTTAPSKLKFTDDTRTAYEGTDENEDNVVRINVNVTNPVYAAKSYKKLAVVVYALGFDTQRRTDGGTWIEYSNEDPIYTEILNFKSGENRVTYFDFRFTLKERAQLGTFVTKVFDMDEKTNELGYYAEEYCFATTENSIILPGTNKSLPAITLAGLSPEIIYNDGVRYINITGRGVKFFKSGLLDKIELRGEDGTNYSVPLDNIIPDQGEDPVGASIMLDEYMTPGKYTLHFIWKTDAKEEALDGVPQDFTSDAMSVVVSSDERYSNSHYGIVTVQRAGGDKYTLVPYNSETELENAQVGEDDLILAFRGDILRDKENPGFYRLSGKDKDVNINFILNYHGDDLTLEEKSDGTVEVLMDGKITTVGANTTVRNGTAAFRLKSGMDYVIPIYNSDGEIIEHEYLTGNEDYLELKWDNAFDILTTVGGFLINMKYGVLGKIENDDDTKSDIISFGGSLDLGFMTPGGAAEMRRNNAAGAKWTVKGSTEEKYDDSDDGMSFGLTFDEESGMFTSQPNEKDIAPTNADEDRIEAGATIHDVLYGGSKPGYIGINMEAHVTLPQIVKFLPNKIEGELSVNTISGYNVGVDAQIETATFSMAMAFVVKASPSGAPIPDKLFFSIAGFEPGFNVDGLGVVWITGGGGGFDNLYDTIYGKDGVPPLTLLLNVEFDITKIMTGSADLELSLRSVKITFSDLSLKMLRNAKFLDGGEIAVGWYPNFSLNLSAGVNFAQIMSGRFTITAAAGKDTADFVQFVLNVAIGLPKYIPIVGGMELASAELGGGSEKVWGSVTVLSLIRVGFTYYWGGSIEFTHGNPSGSENFATLSSDDDDGVKRTKTLYNELVSPTEVEKDPSTGRTQFASIGGNLSYSAGSAVVSDFDERVKSILNADSSSVELQENVTEIITNSDRTSHLVIFGENSDYILSVSRADGKDLTEEDVKKALSVKQGSDSYGLRFYEKPEHDASDDEKRAALEKANVNVSGNTAYIAIPGADIVKPLLIEFSDGNAYDIGAIRVNPISELTSCGATLNGDTLEVSWSGSNIGDNARIIVLLCDGGNIDDGIILNENEIFAKAGGASVKIPEKTASGEYTVRVTLSDEGTCFATYDAGKVTVANAKAPGGIDSVVMTNCGDDKLEISVNTAEKDFDGYLVEVYEDGKLADTGLYFKKGERIIVGGRYSIPVMGEDGTSTGESVTVGYTPGKEYSAKVRLCNIAADADGNEIYHCSPAETSEKVVLKESTQPSVTVGYDKSAGTLKITSDVPVSGELYINGNTAKGEWYEFSDKALEHSQKLGLPDGEYSIEFAAVDEDGDHATVRTAVNVDTTAPVVLLASPINGGFFEGDTIIVEATADSDAVYTFTIDGNKVLPKESDIFASGRLMCTLPLGESKDKASVVLEICAKDTAGNETVKRTVLSNKKVSDINEISVFSEDKTVTDGKLTLDESEMVRLMVCGTTENGEVLDITNLPGTVLEVVSGTSAALDGTLVTAGFAGQTLVRAEFALGGNEYLYDGVVIATVDNTLIFSALDEVIAEAKKITNDGYTDSSFRKLTEAINGAEQIRNAENITQNDIDSAATDVSNAIAGLKKKSAGTGSTGGSSDVSAAYYTVNFNSNGGSTVAGVKIVSGNRLSKPADPVKDGYVFGGWYTDKRLTAAYNFSSAVTKSFTLYAKWTPKDETEKWENPFVDVNENDWFYENVKYAVRNGLFNGVSATEFAPRKPLTRAMLVTVLWRAEGKPYVNYAVPFTDVRKDAYYFEALRWAASEGIVKGVSESEFAPERNITREQIAAIMFRYAEYKNTAPVGAWAIRLDYRDLSDISDWAVEAVMFCKLRNIMTGDNTGAFNPKNNASRAEAAAILNRFLESGK